MATVNKNFRIKQGLVVEGTTGTINGNNILTEGAGDSYILGLVGGATYVKSVDTVVFSVNSDGKLSINSNIFDAYGAASSAQSAAQSYADNVASQAQSAAESYADGKASQAQSAAEGYADGLASDILDGTSAFTEVNVNSVAAVKASTVAVTSAGTVNAFTFDGTAFKTAKALVKFGTAGHSQVSEILLTLDAVNNIAITEYAEVGTNGELGTITASYNSGTVAIQVTTNQANTNVMVYATLLI